MDQAVQPPLALHFLFAPQVEAIQSLGGADVAEHRLHHRHPMAVDLLAPRAIYPMLHSIGVVGLAFVLDGKRYLATRALAMVRRRRVLHTLVFLRAVSALQQTV